MLRPISTCWSQVQCVCPSREGSPSKKCFTPNQIEDLSQKNPLFPSQLTSQALWHASGNKYTSTHTNKHVPLFLFVIFFFWLLFLLIFKDSSSLLLNLSVKSCLGGKNGHGIIYKQQFSSLFMTKCVTLKFSWNTHLLREIQLLGSISH